ncbi:hypothetical protein AURDEDRAFT_128501 [Auricularia subglabra TFB-10046 SS5]|uniref:Uncharacterized protein n=1 Tax=Auricularia subglabra (strain TFB-10046 / SS5) TaxID=717982 RepID=J0LIK3_AURST|nr:hypothetical protein AURDEDRAFT_128501 [Auricularia subglabra TFB-10046 SS5]
MGDAKKGKAKAKGAASRPAGSSASGDPGTATDDLTPQQKSWITRRRNQQLAAQIVNGAAKPDKTHRTRATAGSSTQDDGKSASVGDLAASVKSVKLIVNDPSAQKTPDAPAPQPAAPAVLKPRAVQAVQQQQHPLPPLAPNVRHQQQAEALPPASPPRPLVQHLQQQAPPPPPSRPHPPPPAAQQEKQAPPPPRPPPPVNQQPHEGAPSPPRRSASPPVTMEEVEDEDAPGRPPPPGKAPKRAGSVLEDASDGDDDEMDLLSPETGKSKPGPLTAAQEKKFNALVGGFATSMSEFSKETGKSAASLWDRACMMVGIARDQTIWNLYTHWWYRVNKRDVEGGETVRTYAKRCSDEYHAKIDHMTDDEKVAYKEELRAWADRYEGEIGAETVDSGETFKTGKSKPGPLTAAQEKKFNALVGGFATSMSEFSKETGKSAASLWDRACMMVGIARDQTIWNLYTHWWYRVNKRDVEGGETVRTYAKRCSDEYHAKIDHMTDDEKVAYKEELRAWADRYEGEIGAETVDSGETFKVMRRAANQLEHMTRALYTHYNVGVCGVVVSIDPTDPAAVASNLCFANDPVFGAMLEKREVHIRTLGAHLCHIFGFNKRYAVEKRDWSHGAYLKWTLRNQKERRKGLREAFLFLQTVLLGEDAPSQAEWVNFETQVFSKGLRLINWPKDVDLPSAARDKFRSGQMRKLVKALYRMFRVLAEENGVPPADDEEIDPRLDPTKIIRFEPFTEDELAFRDTKELRARWLQVPIWTRVDGSVILRVEDFEGKKKGKKLEALRKEFLTALTKREKRRSELKKGEEDEEDEDSNLKSDDDEDRPEAPDSKPHDSRKPYVDVSEAGDVDEDAAPKRKATSTATKSKPAGTKKRRRAQRSDDDSDNSDDTGSTSAPAASRAKAGKKTATKAKTKPKLKKSRPVVSSDDDDAEEKAPAKARKASSSRPSGSTARSSARPDGKATRRGRTQVGGGGDDADASSDSDAEMIEDDGRRALVSAPRMASTSSGPSGSSSRQGPARLPAPHGTMAPHSMHLQPPQSSLAQDNSGDDMAGMYANMSNMANFAQFFAGGRGGPGGPGFFNGGVPMNGPMFNGGNGMFNGGNGAFFNGNNGNFFNGGNGASMRGGAMGFSGGNGFGGGAGGQMPGQAIGNGYGGVFQAGGGAGGLWNEAGGGGQLGDDTTSSAGGLENATFDLYDDRNDAM